MCLESISGVAMYGLAEEAVVAESRDQEALDAFRDRTMSMTGEFHSNAVGGPSKCLGPLAHHDAAED